MTISVDWLTKVISIEKTDMVLIQPSPPIYQLDLDIFRLALKSIEESDDGMPQLDTHSHNTTVTVGGAILARVVEIINGYTVTFEDDQYAVNLVGANSNVGDVVNVNQVSVRSSNSAGLQDLNSLQAASYGGRVALDITSAFSGTVFPVGTRAFPASTPEDAHTIATNRGIRVIEILSDMTLATGDFSDGFVFRGDSPASLTLTLDTTVDVFECTFENLTLTGVCDDLSIIRDCHILAITGFNGTMERCAIEASVGCDPGAKAEFYNCYSGVAGGGVGQVPTIDLNNAGENLIVRNYAGGMKISDSAGAIDASLDFFSGRIEFDATVTAGDWTVRGDCEVTDNSTGTAVVTDMTISTYGLSVADLDSVADAVWDEDLTTHTTANSAGKFLADAKSFARNAISAIFATK